MCLFLSCKESKIQQDEIVHEEVSDTLFGVNPKEITFEPSLPYDTLLWTKLAEFHAVQIDMRYASEHNFMKEQIYECGECFLRPTVANQLSKVINDLQKDGYGLIIYDCYRPLPAQQKLWDIMPNAMYVTPPKKGSMHNRGHAVDVGLIKLSSGEILDMGTEFDYFGEEAHYAYEHLSDEIKRRRFVLRDRMKRHGFSGIRTEWWHFSYKKEPAKLSDWEWWCG